MLRRLFTIVLVAIAALSVKGADRVTFKAFTYPSQNYLFRTDFMADSEIVMATLLGEYRDATKTFVLLNNLSRSICLMTTTSMRCCLTIQIQREC